MQNCTGFIFCAFHDFLSRKVFCCFLKKALIQKQTLGACGFYFMVSYGISITVKTAKKFGHIINFFSNIK